MSNARSEQVVSGARGLRPLPGAVLLAAMVLLPALGAPKAKPTSTPAKPKAAKTAEVTTRDDAAASRLLWKADPVIEHPEKATETQLVQAAHDLALATELEPDLELQPWFHAHLGTVLYARAKAKRGPERKYLVERASVQFHLAALTHRIDIYGSTDASDVRDYRGAGDATASFILYHIGLLDYELGRPSGAVIPLDLLLAAAADHELERPEYVRKARTLLAEIKRSEAKHGR